MDNDDILKAAQEAPVNEEYERTVSRSALHIAIAIGITCALIMIAAEWFVFKKFDFGKPFLIVLTSGLADLLEQKKNQSKKMLITGIIKTIFATFLLLLYITTLMGVI